MRPSSSKLALSLTSRTLRSYSTQSARSKMYTKGMLKEFQRQDLYSLRSIIDPRIPGANDREISSLFSPIVNLMRKLIGILKVKKGLGFFEDDSKMTMIKRDFLSKIQRIYECTNINNEKAICTPNGYDALKNRIQEIIRIKKQFQNSDYQYKSMVNIAFANIPKSNTLFVQVTACIQLPDGKVDYVVFERDTKSETGSWKFAGWIDPSKVYRKASMSELLGTSKEQTV